jgi:N-acetylglucosamine kinase-like BadF-type ATPase
MLYLGVDSGGTKTAAVLADTDGHCTTAVVASGNIAASGREKIKSLLGDILGQLSIADSVESIGGATFAFAGAGREKEKQTLSSIIAAAGFAQYTVMTDAQILHYGIFDGRDGILVASGTGSVGLAKTESLGYRQFSGLGFVLGDEGSGFFIGKCAIQMALDEAQCGQAPSPLTESLLAFYKVQKSEELVTITYASPTPQRLVASCARTVCDRADRDEAARRIVQRAGQALADLAITAATSCGFDRAACPVALTGSVGASQVIRAAFEQKLQHSDFACTFYESSMSAAAAAALHAMRQAGHPPDKTVLATLKTLNV